MVSVCRCFMYRSYALTLRPTAQGSLFRNYPSCEAYGGARLCRHRLPLGTEKARSHQGMGNIGRYRTTMTLPLQHRLPQNLAQNCQINYEVFGAWLSSGLDPDRLAAKLGRLLGQLTGRSSQRGDHDVGDGGKAAKGRAKARKRLLKGGVRGLFEAIDKKATGAVGRHDMKVILCLVTQPSLLLFKYVHAFYGVLTSTTGRINFYVRPNLALLVKGG